MRRERILLLGLVAVAILVWVAAAAQRQSLTITVLDVGQGDSILVQTPDRRAILVDAGGRPGTDTKAYDVGRQVVLPSLLVRGVRRLQAVVLTHPHEDHCGGLASVLSQVPVDLLLVPAGPDSDSPAYRRLLDTAAAHKVSVARLRAGMALYLGKDVSCRVLGPPRRPFHGTDADENNNSVVLRIGYRQFSALLAGDIEAEAERQLVEDGAPLRATMLKVPHHGSASSCTEAFLREVRPQVAVISVGARNPFNHPTQQTLQRLQAAGAQVYRTDWQGAVTVTTDGVATRLRTAVTPSRTP